MVFLYIEYPCPSMPKPLSIDEFKGNAGRNYPWIIKEPEGDILPGHSIPLPYKAITWLYYLSFSCI